MISANKETKIIDDMMQDIVTKKLVPGGKIPSENVLAEKYQVPRMTVRHALTKLEEQGMFYSKQGKGRYLKGKSQQIQLHLTGKTSFTEKMKQSGYDVITQNIYCERISYDAEIYQLLAVGEREKVYKIGRLRYMNDEPIAIHYSFVSEERFPSIAADGPKIKSMFAYYRQIGYTEFASNKSLLSTTFPTLAEQQLLSCGSMLPVIVVESDCIDVHSQHALEHTKIVYRGDRFKYDITMDMN